MLRRAGRYLFAELLLLLLSAALCWAQQPPSPGAGHPGGAFEHKTPPSTTDGGIPGDPFGADSADDPFSNDRFFQSGTDADSPMAGDTAAPPRPSSPIDLHGYLESRNRLRTRDAEAISTRQRAWLAADGPLVRNPSPGALPSRFFASAALDIDPAAADLSDDHALLRLYAHEAYLTIDARRSDFILGCKMLRWGTGDGINPMDLINPLDHRDPIASGRSDARIPVLLGQAIVQLPAAGILDEAALEGVVVPLGRVNKLNAPGSAWESRTLKQLRDAEAQGQLILNDQQRPDRALEEAEFGLRLAATFSGWDLALIGFRGYVDTPVFARERPANAGQPQLPGLTPIHPTFSAVGLNFAKGLERSTLRGELALKPDLPVMQDDAAAVPGYERCRVVEGVIGLDRTFGTNLYANLQYFFTVIDDAEELARERFDHGLSYDIHDLFLQDALEAGLRGIVSFSDQGWTGEIYGEYTIGDNWLLAASLLFFEGSETGRYGQFTENDILTLRLRRSF
jgi:hypothetical protein